MSSFNTQIPATFLASATFNGIEYEGEGSTKHAAVCNLCTNLSRMHKWGEPTKIVTHHDKVAYFIT